MPDFWQFPTVSMGLGPMMAIYQARFMRYLENRGILPAQDRKIWCFLGDGETDEPESMGAITMPVRERLDNLVFVINCNLQRLDGPVRGNGKIIQELEAAYQGAGWNVIKVVWGSRWDPLLARDYSGALRKIMEECVDGDYQAFKAKGGAYTRENFFGRSPELKEMVAHLSDEDIWRLNRGGHDPNKVYAAYHQAVHHKGRPTVILAKTVKGFGMGEAGEGQNITHQKKKLDDDDLKRFRRCASMRERRSSRFRISMRSRASSKAAAIASCRRRWRSCEFSRCSCATRTSAIASCRSCPTKRARSAWKACSARSASIPRSASCTRRKTRTS
jgi:pyruvate dehydrogenase E1 component